MTNELKPVAWLCAAKDGENVEATSREFIRDEFARFGRIITPLVIIHDTHRVVSVELLENIAQTLGKCGYFRGDIRAIIDNKEQQ